VKYNYLFVRISKNQAFFRLFLALLLIYLLVGCSDNISLPSVSQLVEFENAGPADPIVDMGRMVRAKIGGGAYRVVPDDVLELTMPTILRIVTAESPNVTEQITPYVCRVSEKGTIALPVVGEIDVEGKSLAEIESAIIDIYYPKYAVIRPPVFARVLEYKTAKVSITGAVNNPGVYELRSDKKSLVSLLMEAGGIIDEGAALIRIIRSNEIVQDDAETLKDEIGDTLDHMLRLLAERAQKQTDEVVAPATYPEHNKIKIRPAFEQITPPSTEGRFVMKQTSFSDEVPEKNPELRRKTKPGKTHPPKSIVLPVKGYNIPFADVALQDGDSVIVERLEQPLITVIGLVNNPGNFLYPPGVQYNLMQVLGFAGDLNFVAEPHYATIYRLKPDGEIVSAVFKIIEDSKLTEALSTVIKPGDIIAIEQTPRTRTKLFLDRVFRINFGTYIRMEDAWE
jgi:protein involved in polysaccharide export with SLBB domain